MIGQSAPIALDVTLVGTFLQLLGVFVGSVVVYQALRGYRRNDSRAMLFLGLGLLVLGPVHFALALSTDGSVVAALTVEIMDVLGLGLILYSLTWA